VYDLIDLDALSFSIYFPIESSFKSAKCRRSSALDLTFRTLPRFRREVDSHRPLYAINYLHNHLYLSARDQRGKQ